MRVFQPGPDTFLELADTPISYSSQADKLVSVNSGETALEFVTGSSSGQIQVETPTGSVDSANQSFTVTAEPQWVIADGITYFDGNGYSYSALTITMDIPPSQYIKAFI